jgi:hypothetical protein
MSTQKKSIQRLNDRVIGLEQSIQSNQSYLEQIKNLLTQTDSKKGLIDRKLTTYIHILARESPYPNTNLPRFFVNNKLVPWEVSIDLYDPPFISFPVEYFKIDKLFVDEEANDDSSGKETERLQSHLDHADSQPRSLADMTSAPVVSSPSTPRFSVRQVVKGSSDQVKTRKNSQSSHQVENHYMWNCSVEIEDPRNPGKKIFVDRKSWMAKIDQATSRVFPFIYSLDASGYPKNPIGRTGSVE